MVSPLPKQQKCARCRFECYYHEMHEHKVAHTRLKAMSAKTKAGNHAIQACPFGDYITRSGNLPVHMMRMHGHYTVMTKRHSLPLYKQRYKNLDPHALQAIILRDWKLGKVLGLDEMRLPLDYAANSQSRQAEMQQSSVTATELDSH